MIIKGDVITIGTRPAAVQLDLSKLQLPSDVVDALRKLAAAGDLSKLSADEQQLLANHTLLVTKFRSDPAEDRPPQIHFDLTVVK